MKVVILDGYNLIYRARYSGPTWQTGPDSITFRFFRSLRPIIEKLEPDKVYFVTEGYPKMRMEKDENYKGTRVREVDEEFSRQKKDIISILSEHFPVEVIRHPHYECDDVVSHLVTNIHSNDETVVVSTDTDFLQLYNTAPNFKLYNPIKKQFTTSPDFDYVSWKALRGDGADNITGFQGVGDKTALALINDAQRLEDFLDSKPSYRDKFNHNKFMIKFHEPLDDLKFMEFSGVASNWSAIKESFEKMEFKSITKEKSWVKFKNTFLMLE